MNGLALAISNEIESLGIFAKGTDSWVLSNDVARIFGKTHKNVLRSIRKKMKDSPDDFNQLNFVPVETKDQKGEDRKAFILNRKSFPLVVMGFTGKKALLFKIKYIEAFEAMSRALITRQLSKDGYKEMTSAVATKLKNRFCFAREANMINLIVLGISSAEYRKKNNVGDGHIRDKVDIEILELLDKAQRLNAQLILAGLDYKTRKGIIEQNFARQESVA